MSFANLCGDELNIIFNYLSQHDVWSIKLLNKYYEYFMDTEFRLENYVHKKGNIKMIKKHARYLEKIIISGHDGITDDILMDMHNLKILDLCYNNTITDNGLKNIPDIQKLTLKRNMKITDNGLKYIPNIKILNLTWNNRITDGGLKHIPNIRVLNLDENDNITLEGLKNVPHVQEFNFLNK